MGKRLGEGIEFEEWLAKKAPGSVRDYMRYWGKAEIRRLIEGLEFGRFPCNSWILKLARNWLNWAIEAGLVSFDRAAAKLLELRHRERVCRSIRDRSGCRGAYVCPEKPVLSRIWWAEIIQRAVAYSGIKAKHLWKLPSREPVIDDGHVVVWDFEGYREGKKGINIVILPKKLAEHVLDVVVSYSYMSRGAWSKSTQPDVTPVKCFRKYHYELCKEACRPVKEDTRICDFIQGRLRPVSVVHYLRYREAALRVQQEVWPLIDKLLKGTPLSMLVERLKDKPALDRVENYSHLLTLREAKGFGKLLRDMDVELAFTLSLYANFL